MLMNYSMKYGLSRNAYSTKQANKTIRGQQISKIRTVLN